MTTQIITIENPLGDADQSLATMIAMAIIHAGGAYMLITRQSDDRFEDHLRSRKIIVILADYQAGNTHRFDTDKVSLTKSAQSEQLLRNWYVPSYANRALIEGRPAS